MSLIKREDAIKAVRESRAWHFNEIVPVLSAIKGIPSAENKGEWIEIEEDWRKQLLFWECSECGQPTSTAYNFCPNCGARMK